MMLVSSWTTSRLRMLEWRHPEWWIVVSSVAAWVVLLTIEPHILLARTPAISTGSQSLLGHMASEAALCLAMIVAMMLPLITWHGRFVALSSFWARRQRAIVEFVGGYIAVWMLASLMILAALHALYPLLGEQGTLVIAFGAAAVWQLIPAKRVALSHCHRTASLTARDRGTDIDCVRFGATIGHSCVAACWGLMAAVMSTHALIVMVLLFTVQLWERSHRRPNLRVSAAFITGVGSALLLLGLAGSEVPD
jgi:predicted metal-binding membrane protein